jgi:hypothetical protein
MALFSIESEARRQRAPQPPEAFEGLLPAAVPAHFELPIGCDPNPDLIASLSSTASTTAAGSRTARLLPTLRPACAAAMDIPNQLHIIHSGPPWSSAGSGNAIADRPPLSGGFSGAVTRESRSPSSIPGSPGTGW